MPETPYDVLIVGAGAAGLAALHDIRRAGRNAICLEARHRLGGRVLTIHDSQSPIPIELGPEFVHGRSPESWNIINSARLAAYDCDENAVQIRDGHPIEQVNSWDQIAAVTSDMKIAAQRGEDPPFTEFLAARHYPKAVEQIATNFVEGFNAAHREVVGIASLAADAIAAEAIDGDHNFRIFNGYDALIHALAADYLAAVHLNQIVEHIHWARGRVTAKTRSAVTNQSSEFTARAAILTLPLGVLQSADVTFSPEPKEILSAANALRFGHVNRVILRFREPWWETKDHLKDAGFWLSTEASFPTWWTSLPIRTSLLVGWSAGPHADSLAAASRVEVIETALNDLTNVANVDRSLLDRQLQAAHFHDWRNDPFARGAYSYVPAGALPHRKTLATPVEDTLFFSGEATELEGHSATVHGAIASGRRAARQFLAATSRSERPTG